MSGSTFAADNSAEQMRRLQLAADLMRQGRREEGVTALRALVADAPTLAQGHRMLGAALAEAGDPWGAESAFRNALAIDPRMAAAAVGLAEVLRNADRGSEAVEILAPFASDDATDLNLLTYYAFALQSVGRFDEAIAWLQRAAATSPASAVAEHNLAGALGDSQLCAESESAARRAFAKGLDAPETWLVLARALKGQDRQGEAEDAYHQAIGRRPGYADALGDLAQITWTRTGDAEAALAVIDQEAGGATRDPALLVHRAKLLEYIGDPAGAYEALALALSMTEDPMLHVAAAQIAVRGDPERGLEHAQRAFALRPENYSVMATLCQARLAVGRPDEAEPLAVALCERQGWDQYALALLATSWRLLEDPRYADLYDYDRVIGSFRLDTPEGWPSLEAYLDDLRQSLEPLHPFLGHPIGQSVRHGSQTQQDLTRVSARPIKAFFRAIDGPIHRYIEGLGAGADPLRRRIAGRYRFNGVWSVKLRPGAGFHADHVHHKGWLSSACYIALPRAVENGHEGWLKFGEPGIPTRPALAPERFIKPEVGQLILFPSYIWHGTVPFSGDESRLSVAFDVLPLE
jgi:tetratricopeptide (TPR) repeat protein